jgi:hypothetical protein
MMVKCASGFAIILYFSTKIQQLLIISIIVDLTVKISRGEYKHSKNPNKQYKKGTVLPFQPLSLAFNNVNYYVDMPVVTHVH